MRRMALAAAVLSGLLPAGCSTIEPVANLAPGRSSCSYTAGRATQSFAYPPAAMQSGVVAAMDDLRIHSIRQTQDNGSFLFDGTTADGRGVTIAVRPHQGAAGQHPGRLVRRRAALEGAAGPDRHPPRHLAAVGHPRRAAERPGSNPYFSREAIPDAVMLHDQADAVYRDSPVP